MSVKKKYSFPLAMFIIGMLIFVVGAYVRLLGWKYANSFLIIGMAFEAVGLIALLNILFKNRKKQ